MTFDDLSTLKDDMIAFIAGHGLRRMNAFVPEDVPSVAFEDDDLDSWKDFVEHAKAAAVPFITMNSVLLEPEDVAALIAQLRAANYPDADAAELEEAQALMRHEGKTGYRQLANAHGGVLFLYETASEWYDGFQNLLDTVQELGGMVIDDHDDE